MKPKASRVPPLRVITPMSTPAEPPPHRGDLCYDQQIPERFFGGLPGITDKLRWVRTHLPREKGIKIGRAWAWYEYDVVEYIASMQGVRRTGT